MERVLDSENIRLFCATSKYFLSSFGISNFSVSSTSIMCHSAMVECIWGNPCDMLIALLAESKGQQQCLQRTHYGSILLLEQ